MSNIAKSMLSCLAILSIEKHAIMLYDFIKIKRASNAGNDYRRAFKMTNKYGYGEVRTMNYDSLRNLCIRQNWFTAGCNKDYSDMLNKADNLENVTTDDIIEIATTILDNSHNETLEDICFKLFGICNTFIQKL